MQNSLIVFSMSAVLLLGCQSGEAQNTAQNETQSTAQNAAQSTAQNTTQELAPAPIEQVRARLVTPPDTTEIEPITDVPSLTSDVRVSTWVRDLENPWGIEFIGNDTALITEKSGRLRLVENGVLNPEPIQNIPAVKDDRQGGMLDVAIDPDYAENGWVYLSFSHPYESDPKLTMTKIVRGRIKDGVWGDEEALFVAKDEHYTQRGHHFGSRITFDNDGHLFFSVGDRAVQDQAQDISYPNGKIHRINRDGSIPDDNPFIGEAGAYASIYSFGNRNPQGLIFDRRTNILWQTEHGPRGGDEINIIQSGRNYGWPEISYGINYNGTVLTPYKSKEGQAQPVSHWTPSIAPSGLTVYYGDMFPEWNGRLLAGALKYEEIRLVDVGNDGTYKSEASVMRRNGRVRDVTIGPDGAIYAALPKRIARLTPKSGG